MITNIIVICVGIFLLSMAAGFGTCSYTLIKNPIIKIWIAIGIIFTGFAFILFVGAIFCFTVPFLN